MVDMFYDKMCKYCINSACNKKVDIIKKNNCLTYKCDEYIRDKNQIKPYKKPLIVTAQKI